LIVADERIDDADGQREQNDAFEMTIDGGRI
jgi:hypothetical protein